jgi:4-hydroxy-3-methylbut-2-en-1-yl diphosphate reductase
MGTESFSRHISDQPGGVAAPGRPVVATEVLGLEGAPIRCPAAPIVLGALRRLGLDARLGGLVAVQDGLSALLLTSSYVHGRVAAIGAHPADQVAVEAAGRVLSQVVDASRPRRVLLASPRSFCAGVERAIEIVEQVLRRHGPPVYVRKQIVHNAHVVRRLEEQGVIFVEELDGVSPGSPVVFSAHGVSPAVRAEAVLRDLDVVDATCPLVTKVHSEARRFAQDGDTVVLVGHEGHEETEGTLGEAPDRMVLVRDVADVATLDIPDSQRVSYLTQTTLAVDETAEVVAALRERFPTIRGPRSDDICYATTNRQNALMASIAEADLVLVIGSANSSNSQRLVELSRRNGIPAHLVEDVTRIEAEWLVHAGTIALTAGASAPESLVDEVVAALDGLGPVHAEERRVTTEDVRFSLPRKVAST